MNLEQKNLTYVVLFSVLMFLCLPIFFPAWRFMVFAPMLVIVFYKQSYIFCLWWSLLCGLFLDLLSAHTQFGLYAVNYCLTTLLLYAQRSNFFADSLTTLPLMTFFFAALSSMIQWALMYIFENENVFSWQWAMTDILYMPALDSVYAFLCFILPALLFGKRPMRGRDYFI